MKTTLFSFLFVFLFNVMSSAQWWVDGGNLIWPYGDVTISKDLNVDGAVNGAKSYVFLFSHNGGTGSPSVTTLFNNIGSNSSWSRVSAGSYRTTFTDITFDNNKTFNTRSVTFDSGDTQFHYVTYTSGSYLYVQIISFADLSPYDPNISKLAFSFIYYP